MWLISVIQSFARALIGLPESGRWDWAPTISRGGCKLAWTRELVKKGKKLKVGCREDMEDW